MKSGISMRDPTAETASVLRQRANPLDTLKGRTVALMDIGKMRGDEFIDRLEQLCHERGVATRRYKKPTNTRVAPREMIADIAAHCQAVIIALSDCGSCTSCSTHDLSDLDKLGLAGVSVLTEEFRQASAEIGHRIRRGVDLCAASDAEQDHGRVARLRRAVGR